MSSQASAEDSAKLFPHTRWSVVLAASRPDSPESADALEAICRAYWHPLYAYARRSGQSPHDAQDLTQAFFALLLGKHWLQTADRAKGRLRTFLIVALKNFMSKEWRRASTQKRGGAHPHIEFDSALGESFYAMDPGAQLAPDEAFDRQWALTLLDLTLKRLQAEFAHFEALKGSLMAERGTIDYSAMAQQLGINAGAARVAVHRLRKRFREIYREEISQTLAERADLDDELRHLSAALAQD
ncbi:MAG TPA: sigma-70 family RNA polymerase sigma factor [Candidatus Saccharimonadales bacterium]|nr:sigma-70 family RNA polymerase sigma factor [Candidatus Saccharimonadales bacterium]